MPRTTRKWIPITVGDMEWEGPYQCEACGGHVIFDATYLDQVSLSTKCPYCGKMSRTPNENEIIPTSVLILQDT